MDIYINIIYYVNDTQYNECNDERWGVGKGYVKIF
jgi:hypothetical protein